MTRGVGVRSVPGRAERPLRPNVAFVTTIQPETHYCRYLLRALNDERSAEERIAAYVGDVPPIAPLPGTDIRVAWTQDARFPGRVARALAQDGADVAHVQHEFNMYGGPRGALLFPRMLRKLRKRQRVVVTVHSVFPPSQVDLNFLKTFRWPRSRALVLAARGLFRYVYGSVGRIADVVIVHSETMRRAMVESYHTDPAKVHVIPIGVAAPPEKIEPTRFDQELHGGRLILYFGYLVRRKGLEHLVEAFTRIATDHPDARLVLAGGTHSGHEDYVEDLKRACAAAGVADRVHFTGFVSEAEMHALYARASFVVLPYTYSIAASLPLSLAATHSRPVVATRLGTMAEEVREGETGLLVPPGDPGALAAAMDHLLRDEAALRKLADGARQFARERSWRRVAERTEQVYLGAQPRA